MSGQVRVEIAERVAAVTLDRPPVNALSSGFYIELSAVFERIAADAQVSVMVLMSASTRAFCAGADLSRSATHGAARHIYDDYLNWWYHDPNLADPETGW